VKEIEKEEDKKMETIKPSALEAFKVLVDSGNFINPLVPTKSEKRPNTNKKHTVSRSMTSNKV
jgi:hypothetical protein